MSGRLYIENINEITCNFTRKFSILCFVLLCVLNFSLIYEFAKLVKLNCMYIGDQYMSWSREGDSRKSRVGKRRIFLIPSDFGGMQ